MFVHKFIILTLIILLGASSWSFSEEIAHEVEMLSHNGHDSFEGPSLHCLDCDDCHGHETDSSEENEEDCCDSSQCLSPHQHTSFVTLNSEISLRTYVFKEISVLATFNLLYDDPEINLSLKPPLSFLV